MHPLNHHQLVDFAVSFGMALGGIGIIAIACLAAVDRADRAVMLLLGALLLLLSISIN